MRALLLALLATVELGGVFGQAGASGRALDGGLVEVALSVEAQPGSTLVAHLIEPGGSQRTVALAEVAEGRFEGFFETDPVDLVVVFEAVGVGSVQSQPVRLTELGLDPALLGVVPVSTTAAAGLTRETRQWGWLGLGLAAGALALLAVWVLGGEERRAGKDATAEP